MYAILKMTGVAELVDAKVKLAERVGRIINHAIG